MKQGKFIIYPEYSVAEHGFPWHMTNETFNRRDKEILPGDGLQGFMKSFRLKGSVSSAVLRITSLGIFEAQVNGKRVMRDGACDELCPLWTDYRHRVFELEYDILPYLDKNKENRFFARVSNGWWSGRISFGFYGFKPPALCAEIEIEYKDGNHEILATDENWDACVSGPVMTADIWDGEYLDARIPDPARAPELVEWKKAEAFTDYTCEIVPFEGEYVRVNDYIAPKSAVLWKSVVKNGTEYGKIRPLRKEVGDNCEKMTLRAGQHLMLDFGRNVVGRPSIAIKAAKGTNVRFLFAEMLNDSGDPERGNDGPEGSIYVKNYRSALSRFHYVADSNCNRKKLNIARPLHTFYGFRYIEITADNDITVECVTAEVLGSKLTPLGTFECSNAEINRLYSNIEWGFKGNYLSIPTDCPQRDERLGWTGDTQIFCGAASYMADTYEFLRKWLGDARDSQKGFNGEYCDVIPRIFGEGHGGNAAWGDAGLIVTYRLWEFYGDTEVVEENYSAMEDYMKYLEQFGLEGPRTAYGDWLNYEVTNKRYIAVCYYAYDAALMKKFSEILGKNERAKYYGELFDKIVAYYHEKYVVDGEIIEKTQTGYLLPLAFDIISGELYDKTVSLLEQKIKDNNYTLSTGFVGTGILNQTLSKVGLDKLAYSLLLQTNDPSWLYSVRQGATTVWERWNSYTKEKGFGNVGMNSFNHYAYGAVAEWMYANMAGIRVDPDCTGFEESIVLSPCPDTRTDDELPEGQSRITMVDATYRGIHSRWEYENGRFVWNFTIPDGSARVEFPIESGRKNITINDVEFSAKELSAQIIGEKMIFKLPAGEYTVK